VEKVPYMLVLGKNEVSTRQLSVRSRKAGDLGVMERSAFLSRIQTEISDRSL
jgi:threonyl-tRNA synthetase